MRYLPHTDEDVQEMLKAVGRNTLDELFGSIPDGCRIDGEIPLPPAMDEWELKSHAAEVASMMKPEANVLIGAGSYQHHIPETINNLMSRSEFLTAYTPYQPEMAQGTLQGIFEYQTYTARLLGMDVANASMYDGGSALAEALLMALRISRKKKTVALSAAVHPHYREVVATYLKPTDFEIIELPVLENGRTDLSGVADLDSLAVVAVQSPNFFGVIEDLEDVASVSHEAEALAVSCFSEPLAYGLLKNPGKCGIDIACGEGQSFGMNRSFGGPGLGMFGCREKFTRNMPGRLVGQTVDLEGRRGFVLTLATREQHIRREKATSNICSNQGICTLIATMYMASLGGSGLRELAELNYSKAEYFKTELVKKGAVPVFSGPTFNEFVVEFKNDFRPVRERLLEKGIVAGLELGRFYPGMAGQYLFCATEVTGKEIIDTVVSEVQ
ncbi:aminomethyl-transferring glycine dehydrogenase subunit GcvPA [Desulfomarina sp.]